MARCGDCKHFILNATSSDSGEGWCTKQIDESGIGKDASVYDNADKCSMFEEMERVVTGEGDTWNPMSRRMRGFDEK